MNQAKKIQDLKKIVDDALFMISVAPSFEDTNPERRLINKCRKEIKALEGRG